MQQQFMIIEQGVRVTAAEEPICRISEQITKSITQNTTTHISSAPTPRTPPLSSAEDSLRVGLLDPPREPQLPSEINWSHMFEARINTKRATNTPNFCAMMVLISATNSWVNSFCVNSTAQ